MEIFQVKDSFIERILEEEREGIKAKVNGYDLEANTITVVLTKTDYERMLKMYGVAGLIELKNKPILLIFPNVNFNNPSILCIIVNILKGSEEVKLIIEARCPRPVQEQKKRLFSSNNNTCQTYKNKLNDAIKKQIVYQREEGGAANVLLELLRTKIPATPATLEVVKKNSGAEELATTDENIEGIRDKVNAALAGTEYTTKVTPASPMIEEKIAIIEDVEALISETKNGKIHVKLRNRSGIRSLVNDIVEKGKEGINKVGETVTKITGMKRPAKPVMIKNSQQRNLIVTNEGNKYVSFKKALKTIEGLSSESYDNGVALDSIKKKMNYATITRQNGTEIIGRLTGDSEYDAVIGNESLDFEFVLFEFVPKNSNILLELSKTDEIVSIAKVKFQSFSYNGYGYNYGPGVWD
jgi:hypothetical protein